MQWVVCLLVLGGDRFGRRLVPSVVGGGPVVCALVGVVVWSVVLRICSHL